MFRIFAFLAALFLTAISVSSTCLASSADNIRFQLQPSGRSGQVQLSLFSGENGHHSMSSSFRANELEGLDLASLQSPGNTPVRFAIVREAGRVDCTGAGGALIATGTCTFAADAGFNQYLASHGIARPDREESYGLAMVGATRALVDSLAAANYPMPDIDELTSLAAVDVTPAYINDLSRR
ncbi:MAG TPA: hypothetical protein VFP53_07295, partial [Sphingomicrobium sp.]|nr:hypothetical protein [Sphingomicrobium sp.]